MTTTETVGTPTADVTPPMALPDGLCLLTRQQVERITGLGRNTIYDRMSRGQFPRPRRVGRAVRWCSDDLRQWIETVDDDEPRGRDRDRAAHR